MRQFKDNMDKKNEKLKEKALKKWRKKYPNRPIEEFSMGNVSFDSSFLSTSDNNTIAFS